MNCPIDYDDEEEHRKTHTLFLPNIEANTKGEELKNNSVGGNMNNEKDSIGKTQADA